jgi:Thioesterase-like superfamily
VGPARLTVDELSNGRKYSVVQIALQKQQDNGSYQTCATAIITQGNLSMEKGQTIEVPPIIKNGLPHRERDCEETFNPKWISKALPVSTKIRAFLLKGSKNGRYGSREGWNVREFWVGWTAEDQKFDLISLGSLCDNVSGKATLYEYPVAHMV